MDADTQTSKQKSSWQNLKRSREDLGEPDSLPMGLHTDGNSSLKFTEVQ